MNSILPSQVTAMGQSASLFENETLKTDIVKNYSKKLASFYGRVNALCVQDPLKAR